MTNNPVVIMALEMSLYTQVLGKSTPDQFILVSCQIRDHRVIFCVLPLITPSCHVDKWECYPVTPVGCNIIAARNMKLQELGIVSHSIVLAF